MSKAAVDLKFRTEGACRLCRRSASVRPLTRHRLLPGSRGGAYVPVNCVPLCRACHDDVDHRDRRTRLPARRMLRASLWPMEIACAKTAFAIRGTSFDLFYPTPTRELVLARREQYATAS